jgi:uncharacterized protein YycO
MRKFHILLIVIFSFLLTTNFKQTPTYKDGDIIFQTTSGATGKAIQLGTHSIYNHCGVLFFENNTWMIYEAVQPVGKISLNDFNKRGKGIVKRLKDATTVLTPIAITKLKNVFKTYENKNYDEAYNWSDDKMYCSELVYKLYFNALQIELCKLRTLGDFDLSNSLVKEKLNEKYSNHIPLNEPMVAPSDLYNSIVLDFVK